MQSKYDVIVIGAGPAGLMSAIAAGKNNLNVLVIEQSKKPAEKLSITGGGRCNITNAEYNNNIFLKNYGDAGKYLFSPFSKFSVRNTFSFFEKSGLPLVIEARKRVFPKSQSAEDVVDSLLKNIKKNNIEIMTSTSMRDFVFDDQKNIVAIQTNNGKFFAKYFILATGGYAGRFATGDGFKLLKKIGHKIHRPNPNLVPLKSNDKWVHRLSGLALSFMTIRFKQNGKIFLKKTGKLLFTHFGLSGPLIINSSYEIKKKLERGKIIASIDLFPDTNHKMLDKRILKIFERNKNKQIKNALSEIIEDKLAIEILKIASISLELKVHSITQDMRKKIINTMKDLVVSIVDTMGMDRAIVADGGVDLNEIDFKTMTSKLYPNLKIIGDLLNINRPSGGFSLQLCWTTGFVAGSELDKK